jgi:hypothetical protein
MAFLYLVWLMNRIAFFNENRGLFGGIINLQTIVKDVVWCVIILNIGIIIIQNTVILIFEPLKLVDCKIKLNI